MKGMRAIHIRRRSDERGIVLIATYVILAILIAFGAAFFARTYSQSTIALRHQTQTESLTVAEAGIERAIYDLRQDVINDTSPSWIDSDINGMACGADYNNFYILPYMSTTIGSGSYVVSLKNVTGEPCQIWIRSTGTVLGISRTLELYLSAEDINVWNNAIFAGAGGSGGLINGNVDVRGSVHILGDGLDPGDFAMDMGGGANIGNNYEDIPAELSSRVPALQQILFGGEMVETLKTKLRVKKGKVGLSGASGVGEENSTGDAYKETVDGTYVTDGYGGTAGEDNVYSDNGTEYGYDLGDKVQFPSLSDPYLGYATYQQYLRANALVISAPADLAKLNNIKPDSSFSFTDPMGKGSITMDGNGNLTISGIVYVDGGNLNMNIKGSDKTINYTGEGSMLVTGNIGINVNLLTSGGAGSYPNNIIGFMTPNDISFNGANIDVLAIFYGENQITSQKQTDVAGSFVSNYFDMGSQVPSIFQVPEVVNNLPPGMIGASPFWVMHVVSWQEIA